MLAKLMVHVVDTCSACMSIRLSVCRSPLLAASHLSVMLRNWPGFWKLRMSYLSKLSFGNNKVPAQMYMYLRVFSCLNVRFSTRRNSSLKNLFHFCHKEDVLTRNSHWKESLKGREARGWNGWESGGREDGRKEGGRGRESRIYNIKTIIGTCTYTCIYTWIVDLCSSGSLLAEWVWSIFGCSVWGRDHLTDVGRVQVNMKVLGDFHPLSGIVEGKGHKEWLNLVEQMYTPSFNETGSTVDFPPRPQLCFNFFLQRAI